MAQKAKKPYTLTPEQVAEVALGKASNDWWQAEGRYIDPDTSEVDWYDKREELAHIAFIAGWKAAKQ